MGSKDLNVSWITITVFLQCFLLCMAQNFTNDYCITNTTGNGTILFDCSCISDNDVLIIKDNIIGNGNQTYPLHNLTTHLRIGNCYELHLSGITLLNLTTLRTLELHDIESIKVDIQFFSQYSSNMEVLKVSQSGFTLEGSLNIKARKIKEIALNDVTWEKAFNLLLNTAENHKVDFISISNCHIGTLEQINISSRRVNQFILQNNTIETIWTSAILHESNLTAITHNTIGHINFLSMDITTNNFTMRENLIKYIELKGIRVDNASSILIDGNTFFHIEENAFLWISAKENYEEVTISNNKFHRQDRGSLLFSHTLYTSIVHVHQNAIYSATCDCNTLKLLETMTEFDNDTVEDFHKTRYMAYTLFHDTSYCMDQKGDIENTSLLCSSTAASSSLSVIVGVMTLSAIVIGILLYVQKRYKCIGRKKSPMTIQQFNPFNYSANLAYNDDSENEEYVRKANHTL